MSEALTWDLILPPPSYPPQYAGLRSGRPESPLPIDYLSRPMGI
jgi:hypothetical protein